MHLEVAKKSQKLLQLCESEGFETIEDLLEAAMLDSVSPGICVTEECDHTCEVEGDQDQGYCDACGGQTVVSALRLADLI